MEPDGTVQQHNVFTGFQDRQKYQWVEKEATN